MYAKYIFRVFRAFKLKRQPLHGKVSVQTSLHSPSFFAFGSCENDPFEMCTLDEPSPVRDYRRFYFEQISKVRLGGMICDHFGCLLIISCACLSGY